MSSITERAERGAALQSPVPVRAEDVQPPGYRPPAGVLLICPETPAHDYQQEGAADGDR